MAGAIQSLLFVLSVHTYNRISQKAVRKEHFDYIGPQLPLWINLVPIYCYIAVLTQPILSMCVLITCGVKRSMDIMRLLSRGVEKLRFSAP